MNRKTMELVIDALKDLKIHPDQECETRFLMAKHTVIGYLEQQLTDTWIPVTEKLPAGQEEVMACNKDGIITIGYIKKREGYYTCEHLPFVTEDIVAWMPKPPRYEEVSE